MIVHLLDGTYELFRHFYGIRRGRGKPLGAVAGVISLWTPDKDLAQCVVGARVVQVDRRSGKIRDADGVRQKFGVPPERIPDYLALVGDAADGYPGLPGIGPKTAARLIERHGRLEDFPPEALADRERALLFKTLATLRTDAALFSDVESLRWREPTPAFEAVAGKIGDAKLLPRVAALERERSQPRPTD
jgi:5'-3' exonuclease